MTGSFHRCGLVNVNSLFTINVMVGLSFTTLGQRNLKFQQGSLPPQPRRGSRRWLDPVAFHRPGAFLHERLHHRGGQGVDGAGSVTGGAGTLRGVCALVCGFP
ncbi:hypothetical protein JHK87_022723 [Glycine soja]|nr:hypothetical protein JHK87_022723 [Glycine soja]